MIRQEITRAHLAAPKGLVLAAAFAGLGEARGEGEAEALERGRSSSFLRVIWGVGGTELFASDVIELVSKCKRA